MLKKEIITANAILAGLTDEQITAIETLSANDENTIIAARIGETYREWDRRIEEATGIKRSGDEKSYEYLTRAIEKQSGKATELSSQFESIKAEKDRLAQQIKDGGGNTELQEKYTALESKYNTLKSDHAELKKGIGEMETKHTQALFDVKLENELTLARGGIKWKEGYTASITGVLEREVTAKLKGGAFKPSYEDDGSGSTRLMFRNEAGEIMRNPENQLQPYTAAELYAKEFKAMGALAEDRQQTGGGSTPPTGGKGGSGGGLSLDLSGARTRTEADTAIRQALAQQGLVKGSSEYQAAMDAAWEDNKVADMPMQ